MTKTTNSALPVDIELSPIASERIGPNKFRITLATGAGDRITYTMTTPMVMESVNLAVAAINAGAAGVMEDMRIF